MSNEEKLLELSGRLVGLNRTCSNELLKGEKNPFRPAAYFPCTFGKETNRASVISLPLSASAALLSVYPSAVWNYTYIYCRVINQKDSRYNLVSLTEKGRALAERSDALMMELTRIKVQGFTPEEVETLVNLLSRLEANMKAFQNGKHDED